MINEELAEQRALSEGAIERIQKLHVKRHKLHCKILKKLPSIGPEELRKKYWRAYWIECKLQKLWGFPVDANYIKFWRIPGCSCPRMDNDDRYPTGLYVYSGSCPIHGDNYEN